MAAMQTIAGLLREVVDSEKLHHWAVSTPVESGHSNTAWLTVQKLESGSLAPPTLRLHEILKVSA